MVLRSDMCEFFVSEENSKVFFKKLKKGMENVNIYLINTSFWLK